MEPSTSSHETPNGANEDLQWCRVCNGVSDGLHFGIFACRACAAFFRRSISMKKQYVCRKGGDSCRINHIVKQMCRKCRIVRCFEEGMLKECVQNRRDRIHAREKMPALPSTSNDEIERSESETINRPLSNLKLLCRIEENYDTLCKTRRATELSLLPRAMQEKIKNATDSVFGSFPLVTATHGLHLPSIETFIKASFPEFCELGCEDQGILMKHFQFVFWVLDVAYRTYSRVPPEFHKTRTIITEIMYIELDRYEEFLRDAPEFMHTKKDIASCRSLSPFCGPRARLIVQMQQLQMKEEEFLALLAFTLWNSNIPDATTTVKSLAERIRKQATQELNQWYCSTVTENYAERLGEILFLITLVMEAIHKMKETFEICNLLDIFKQNNYMSNFFARSNT